MYDNKKLRIIARIPLLKNLFRTFLLLFTQKLIIMDKIYLVLYKGTVTSKYQKKNKRGGIKQFGTQVRKCLQFE